MVRYCIYKDQTHTGIAALKSRESHQPEYHDRRPCSMDGTERVTDNVTLSACSSAVV